MKKMKRMLIGTLLVFTLCMLTACGNNNTNNTEPSTTKTPSAATSEPETTEPPTTDTSETEAADTESTGGKTLIVYYSASGNTENVSNVIADTLGADLFELEPVEPYSNDVQVIIAVWNPWSHTAMMT